MKFQEGSLPKSETKMWITYFWVVAISLLIALLAIVIYRLRHSKANKDRRNRESQSERFSMGLINEYLRDYYAKYRNILCRRYNLMYSVSLPFDENTPTPTWSSDLISIGLDYRSASEYGYRYVAHLVGSSNMRNWAENMATINTVVENLAEGSIIHEILQDYAEGLSNDSLNELELRKKAIYDECKLYQAIQDMINSE